MEKMERISEKQLTGIMVFLTCFLLWVWSCAILWSGPVDKPVKSKTEPRIDVDRIENDAKRLRKTVEELENVVSGSGVRLKRDPFATLVIPEKISPIIAGEKTEKKEDKKKQISSDIILHGIVSDGDTSLAIIGNEVKREGEFIGEYEIYKITGENVLIKYGDEIFPVYIKQ